MADEPKIVINGKEYPLPDSFTMGERADMEKITGQGYDLEKEGYLGTLALMYVALKRVDPRVTIDDVRDLKEEDLEITGVTESPPPLGASNGSAPPKSKTSEADSENSPEKTPARTGTKS